MKLACPPPISPSGARRPLRVGRRRVYGVQMTNHTPFGEPRPAAAAWRSPALGEATETDGRGSLLLGTAFQLVGRLAGALVIVKPETVIAWRRQGFRLFSTWKSRRGHPGRPRVQKEIRDLMRRMSQDNPLWGAPQSPCLATRGLSPMVGLSELLCAREDTQPIGSLRIEPTSLIPRVKTGLFVCGLCANYAGLIESPLISANVSLNASPVSATLCVTRAISASLGITRLFGFRF